MRGQLLETISARAFLNRARQCPSHVALAFSYSLPRDGRLATIRSNIVKTITRGTNDHLFVSTVRSFGDPSPPVPRSSFNPSSNCPLMTSGIGTQILPSPSATFKEYI